MTLLQTAGVDLSQPETVRAVVDQLDTLVTELEKILVGVEVGRVRRSGFLRNLEHRVRRADAGVHDHHQAAGLSACGGSSLVMPVCSHSAFAPTATASSAIARRVFRAAEDVDDVDRDRDVSTATA